MSYDCLVEVTAQFFNKGDTEDSEWLENLVWADGDYYLWENFTEVFEPEDDKSPKNVRFTEDVVGFTFEVVSEGRAHYPNMCGIEYEISEILPGEVFGDNYNYWVESALQVKNEIKPKNQEDKIDAVRWLELMEHSSSIQDGEYSSDWGPVGRVSLAEIGKLIEEKKK